MKQNNCRTKLKTIIAVMLVMASLFAMSSMVNAGIVELILGEEYTTVAAVSSSSNSLSLYGPANGSATLYYEDGSIKQIRYYDSEGRAYMDTDYTDHGNPSIHTNPHNHYWTWDENGNPTRT